MKTIFIFLDKPGSYFSIDDSHQSQVNLELQYAASLDEVRKIRHEYDQAIGIVSGEYVNISTIEIPVRSLKKAQQVVPFVLEESLISNIEDLHFSILDWHPGEASTVAVIEKTVWSNYLEMSKIGVLGLNQIIPDYALLNLEKNQLANVYVEPNSKRVLIKQQTGQLEQGLALQKQELSYWASDFNGSSSEGSGGIVCNDQAVAQELIDMSDIKADVFCLDSDLLSSIENYSFLIRSFDKFSLFQSSQHDQVLKKVKPWLIASSVIILLSLFSAISFNAFNYYNLIKQNNQLDEKIKTIFSSNFPQVTRIVDAKEQFQRQLSNLRGSSKGSKELLFLLDQLSGIIQKNQLAISELYFTNSALLLTFSVKNFSSLDDFNDQISNSPIAFEQLSSDSQGGKVTAKYRFRARVE